MISIPHQIRPLPSPPVPISRHNLSTFPQTLNLSHKTSRFPSITAKSRQTPTQENGIPIDLVKTLVRFKSRHNYIRVLQVSRRADHPFAGARLLLLDNPGNIHSISFLFKELTETYFDVFATLPPILPPGPLGILGFGAGSAARLILDLYPKGRAKIYGWELDPSVISVGREYFGLSDLEKDYPDRLLIYIGDALKASVRDGFAGILVDLFSKGSLIPELQDPKTWVRLKKSLKEGGRIMVNVGGICVEAENNERDGKLVMEETLKAMRSVFADEVFVLKLGRRAEDSCIALTGELPDVDVWKKEVPKPLRCYMDMWTRFDG